MCPGTNSDQQENELQQMGQQYIDRIAYVGTEKAQADLRNNIGAPLRLWRAAMTEEINALLKSHTWTLVPSSPSKNPVDYKWVFRVKRKSDGSVDASCQRISPTARSLLILMGCISVILSMLMTLSSNMTLYSANL
uniref:uncharacterized protein LOC105349965 n=1 Tax=Fragaria vesca subsp. vesca TaxID=101020 RepID=UPI0005CA5EAD|nr:PREDICTED: uncharacterized protein LOC105349965 [Fragaria vesca subsp. vesca]